MTDEIIKYRCCCWPTSTPPPPLTPSTQSTPTCTCESFMLYANANKWRTNSTWEWTQPGDEVNPKGKNKMFSLKFYLPMFFYMAKEVKNVLIVQKINWLVSIQKYYLFIINYYTDKCSPHWLICIQVEFVRLAEHSVRISVSVGVGIYYLCNVEILKWVKRKSSISISNKIIRAYAPLLVILWWSRELMVIFIKKSII